MTTEPTPSQDEPSQTDEARLVEEASRQIMSLRHHPLLLLYYPVPAGEMAEGDIRNCYQTFRTAGIDVAAPLPELDVLVHTWGGDPVAAYRLAQVIRDFAQDVTFLVPECSYSAGTLLCFAGNRILFGHYAGLGPIDITRGDVELASIDYFSEFAKDSEQKIRDMVKAAKGAPLAAIASDLLCKLVDDVGALKIGEYYRGRTLTGEYAQELLDNYMFRGLSNRTGRRNRVIRQLLFESPSHDFHLDFHMCEHLGLVLQEMDTTASDAAKHVVTTLNDLTERGIICQNITDDLKMPFIAFYA